MAFPSLLWTAYRRYLAKNLWLLLLSVCAIATGVAVILGVDVASVSARRSFALSTEALTGKATHSLVGGGIGIDESLYRTLRVEWKIRSSAPVVEGYVTFFEGDGKMSKGDTSLTLLGIDLLADRAVRDWTSGFGGGTVKGDQEAKPSPLIGSSDRVVVSQATAQRLGWKVGETRTVGAAGRKKTLELAGVLRPNGAASSAALDNLVLADISTAQSVLDQIGRLDRIDLILGEKDAGLLKTRLPEGVTLQVAGTSRQTAGELSSAFHFSLQALSYLCLLVALFLIYNVVSFTVAHRRQSLGRLRILGVTSKELRSLLLMESLALGFVGSCLGVVFGLGLGRGLVPLVSRTINDLYYVQAITQFSIDPWLLGKAFLCGLLATLFAAGLPSVLAARTGPLDLLFRVEERGLNLRGAWWSAGLGLLALLCAGGALLNSSLAAGLLVLLFIVVGFGLMVPIFLCLSVVWALPFIKALPYRMALQGLLAHLERTATAAVALTVAVAATVSIAMMVSSFRGTLISWLGTTLSADVYLSLSDRAAMTKGATLSPDLVEQALQLPGVTDWIGQRVMVVPSETGETFLVGVRTGGNYSESLTFLDLADDGWARFEDGEGVFLTEPYARRTGKFLGSRLTIETPKGQKMLPVLGVYYSYAPDRNMALMAVSAFQPLFGDGGWSGLGFYLGGDDTTEIVGRLQALFGDQAEVRATRDLKKLALDIFERTFTVTGVLRYLALGVAVIGVFLSLFALALERETEVRVLRALGFQTSELFRLALFQSVWLGLVTAVLACPLGVVLANVMITVVNRRAFGWTINFLPDWGAGAVAMGLGLGASLLAGLYPAWRWSRPAVDESLRERE